MFKNGNADPVSLNTTDANGFIIITNEFMPVSEGDSLKFVVLSANYTKAEKSMIFSLS